MALTKLWIRVFKDESYNQEILPGFFALLNPSEYSLSRSNNWERNQSVGSPQPEHSYVGGEPDQLSMSLLFDGTGAAGYVGPVDGLSGKFLDLMKYQGDAHEPYFLKICWGTLVFPGVLKSATVNYTLFNQGGLPLRAKIDASFEQVVPASDTMAEADPSSPDLTHVWEVRDGDRLDHISWKIYGRPDYWCEIARVNGLGSSRGLESGQQLTLPPLELSGRAV